MIKVLAKSVIKDNEIDTVISLYSELVDKSKLEAGCISYELFQDINNNILYIIEQWTNEKALEMHRQTEHFMRIVPQISKLRISSDLSVLNKIK